MNGDFWAWSTFIAGLCCGGYAWACTSRLRLPNQLDQLVRVGYSAVVALAVFSNLAYIVWIAGLPLAMGVVEHGQMGEHYWLGPFTGIYAVVMWLTLKRAAKGN